MAVRVLIKRQFKEGKSKEVFNLLNKFRGAAMDQKGYVSGETLINHDNPNKIIVISTWQNIEDWLAWKDNPKRKLHEDELAPLLEKPTEYEAYVYGAYYPKK